MSDAVVPSGYATVVQRLTAAIVDIAICAAIGVGAGVLLSNLLGVSAGTRVFVGYVCVLVTGWVYFSSFESSRSQATPGKRARGIVVTDVEGNRLTFAVATLRYFAKTASALPLLAGFVMAAFTARRQALHDILAECVVMKREAVSAAARQPAASTPAVSPSPVTAAPPSAAPALSSAQSPQAAPAPASVVRVVGVEPSGPPLARERAGRQEAQAEDHGDHTVLIDAAYAPTIMAAPRRGWTLATMSGPDAGRVYPLGWEVRIGREPDNTIRLVDDKVSRHHAKIVQQPDGYVLTDLDSSNGTMVDGERIGEPRLLRPGAEITIGSTRLVLRTPEADAA